MNLQTHVHTLNVGTQTQVQMYAGIMPEKTIKLAGNDFFRGLFKVDDPSVYPNGNIALEGLAGGSAGPSARNLAHLFVGGRLPAFAIYSVSISVSMYVCLSVCLSVLPSVFCLSTYVSFCLSIHVFSGADSKSVSEFPSCKDRHG